MTDITHYSDQELSLLFLNDEDFDETTEDELNVINNAVDKFNNHIDDILRRIESSIEYQFSNEAITEDLKYNDYEFTEDGNIY